MMNNNLYGSPEQASRVLITHILEAMLREPERPFTIALSGGSNLAVLFEVWEKEYIAFTPWTRLYFYWTDERCVPFTDEQSNFGLAYRCLLSKVGIQSTHYYRIIGEIEPQFAAQMYASIVQTTVPQKDGVPVFDFVLLEIEKDRYASSDFPDWKELFTAKNPYCVSVDPYDESVHICMTGIPMIRAKHTCFLTTGEHIVLNKVLDKELADVYSASYVWHHARCARLYASL